MLEQIVEEQTYQRIVEAALAETKSKKALAEALALDIPARGKGGSVNDEHTVMAELEEARQRIIDAGGEPRSVATLSNYRDTALWVKSSPVNMGTFRWADASFTAHYEAFAKGVSYETFAANPKTARETRTTSTKPDGTPYASKDGPPASVIPNWTPEQQIEAAQELLTKPEVVAQLPAETRGKAVDALLSAPGAAQDRTIHEAISGYADRVTHPTTHGTERELSDEHHQIAQKLDEMKANVDIEGLVVDLNKALSKFLTGVSDYMTKVGKPWIPGGSLGGFQSSHIKLDLSHEALNRIEQWYETGETDIDAFVRSVLKEGAE